MADNPDISAATTCSTTVLVCLHQIQAVSRNREVTFYHASGGRGKDELIRQIKSVFRDILKPDSRLILQIYDKSWDVYVDLIEQSIENRAIVKVYEDDYSHVVKEHDDVIESDHSLENFSISKSTVSVMILDIHFYYTCIMNSTSTPNSPGHQSVQMQLTVTPKGLGLKKPDKELLTSVSKIKEAAKIYKKEDRRPLSDYQIKINEAAANICIENPSMLHSRARLLHSARDIVDSNYAFKKGKSRSKRYLDSDDSLQPKRKKLSQEFRDRRIKELEIQKKSLNEKLDYKEKRRQVSENEKKYRICEEITEEIETLQNKLFSLDSELSDLQKKEKKAKWYKTRRLVSISSSETTSVKGSVSPTSEDIDDNGFDSVSEDNLVFHFECMGVDDNDIDSFKCYDCSNLNKN
jgi:hypothetical protein